MCKSNDNKKTSLVCYELRPAQPRWVTACYRLPECRWFWQFLLILHTGEQGPFSASFSQELAWPLWIKKLFVFKNDISVELNHSWSNAKTELRLLCTHDGLKSFHLQRKFVRPEKRVYIKFSLGCHKNNMNSGSATNRNHVKENMRPVVSLIFLYPASCNNGCTPLP